MIGEEDIQGKPLQNYPGCITRASQPIRTFDTCGTSFHYHYNKNYNYNYNMEQVILEERLDDSGLWAMGTTVPRGTVMPRGTKMLAGHIMLCVQYCRMFLWI